MSTITDFTIKESYIEFNNIINDKIKHIDEELQINFNKANYISVQLRHVGESHGLKSELYNFISNFYNDQVLPELSYLQDINFKLLESEEWYVSKNVTINSYFKAFTNILLYIYDLKYIKALYTRCIMDYQSYYRILNLYYNNVANSLLKGNGYIMPGIGKLKVISRRMKSSKLTKFKVDWGESLNVLKEFAKNHHFEIYDLYINKKINKQAFIHALKPYCYDEKNNPNGFKWLVHLHKDYSAWIIFCNKRINPNYNIVPSNFVMNETRSQVDFTNNIKSIDEIYDSNRLGFRDKLNCLLRYDFNYINRFPTI